MSDPSLDHRDLDRSDIGAEIDRDWAQLDHIERVNQFAKMSEEEREQAAKANGQQQDRAKRKRSLSTLISDLRPRVEQVRRGGYDIFICPLGGGDSVVHIEPDLAKDQISCECGGERHTSSDVEWALRLQAQMLPRKCTEATSEFGHYQNCLTCKIWSAAAGKVSQVIAERIAVEPREEEVVGTGSVIDLQDGLFVTCPFHPNGRSRNDRWGGKRCEFCDVLETEHQEKVIERVEERRQLRMEQAVRDGTVVSDALAMFPPVTAKQVRDREVQLDAIPGVLGPVGTITEITGYYESAKSLGALMIAGFFGGSEVFKDLWGLLVRVHGPVLYIAREGRAGWTRRIRAWEAHHGRPLTGVQFIENAMDLKNPVHLAALATLIRHFKAELVVIDSVALTGGGKEDQEDYSQYRSAALDLAQLGKTRVILITNSGHGDKTRGRNAAVLEDGVDISLSFLKQGKGRADERIEVGSNKKRDTDALELTLVFEAAGEVDPETGKTLSGVLVRPENQELLRRKLAAENLLLDRTKTAIRNGGCTCSEGDEGDEPRTACRNGLKSKDLAEALKITIVNSLTLLNELRGVMRVGVRRVGKTQAQRWHLGRNAGVADFRS